MSNERPKATPEMLAKMTTVEKTVSYAKDVLETENNPEYLGMRFQKVGKKGSVEGMATYIVNPKDFVYEYQSGKNGLELIPPVQEPEEFIYDFLFGGGSLGHPMKPTDVGKAAIKIAEIMNTKVKFYDFTFASYDKQITVGAIEQAFFEFFLNSDNAKTQEKLGQIGK